MRQRFITTIKNVIEKRKKNLRSLIRFHSADKIDNYNRELGRGRKEKTSKRNYRTSQNIRIINFFLRHCCQSPFSCHSPPHLPRRPSNTVLIAGPSVGASLNLIWSYSCVFLPPMSTAIKTSAFFFWWELSMTFYIFHRHSLPS